MLRGGSWSDWLGSLDKPNQTEKTAPQEVPASDTFNSSRSLMVYPFSFYSPDG
jgi:hypothetical protein